MLLVLKPVTVRCARTVPHPTTFTPSRFLLPKDVLYTIMNNAYDKIVTTVHPFHFF